MEVEESRAYWRIDWRRLRGYFSIGSRFFDRFEWAGGGSVRDASWAMIQQWISIGANLAIDFNHFLEIQMIVNLVGKIDRSSYRLDGCLTLPR